MQFRILILQHFVILVGYRKIQPSIFHHVFLCLLREQEREFFHEADEEKGNDNAFSKEKNPPTGS